MNRIKNQYDLEVSTGKWIVESESSYEDWLETILDEEGYINDFGKKAIEEELESVGK